MRRSFVAVWAALAVGGCFGPPSQLDPKASVALSGTVQLESGAPAATHVKLIRHPDPLQAISEVIVAVGSVGLACIAGQLDICSSFAESDTGGDGGYRFALRGSDTQGSTGEALTFTAFANCAGANCAVASDFQIQRSALTIPAMRFWTEVGALVQDASSGDINLSWPAVEASVGGAAADDYRVTIAIGDGSILWQQDAKTATATTIERRVTQDLQGSWSVVAQRKQPGNGTDFTVSWYATQQDYPSSGLTPLSRSADCFTQGADGMPARLARPCPVTDGNPGTKFVPVAPPPCPMGQTCATTPLNNWILIDNGFAHPMSFLVLYDVAVSNPAANILVEISDDLMSWTLLQTLTTKPYQTTPLVGAARFLRLRLSDPNAQFSGGGNGEIAIFAPF